MAQISPLRQPLEGRTRDGARVRLRPAPAAGRWLADVWDPEGVPVAFGVPLAVGSDLTRFSLTLSGLTITGAADPTPAESLDSQGVGAVAG